MSEATMSTALAPTALPPPPTINCDSSQHGTPQNGQITFAIDTPESIRNDVVSKDARRRARAVAAEIATASLEGTNLKRSATVAGLSLDGHLTKRMNNISINTDGSNTGLAPAGAPLRCPKNKGGRPRKNTTAKVHKRQTHLRTNRPVQTPVIDDAWCIIFENSPPSFLMEAYVTGSRFYRMLQHTSLWRTARHKTYGLDHPDPPHNMTEYQYADLLSGVGCQAYGCLNRQARTVYWAYQRRWCDKCVIRLTVEVSS